MQHLILFLVLFFVATGQIYSQQERYVLPLPESAMSAVHTLPSNEGPVNTSFELVDLTGDSLVLGYLPTKDKDNDRVAITTPVLKQDWLQASMGENMATTFVSRGTSGLYILNDLSTGVTDAGNFVRIKANVYESPAGANAYFLLNSIDTFIINGVKNVDNLGTDINNAMGATLLTSRGGITVKTPTGKTMTRDEVIKTEKDKYSFISNGIIPTGIYMTFEDFKANRPSFGQFYIRTDTLSKTIEVNSFTQTDSTLRPVAPWAIAVNGELYYYSNKKLYAVEATGANLTFSKFLDPMLRTNNAGFWRMTVGDLLKEKYNNPFDNLNTLSINNYRNRGISGEPVKLNADTGAPEL